MKYATLHDKAMRQATATIVGGMIDAAIVGSLGPRRRRLSDG